jgi:hypothetical protein
MSKVFICYARKDVEQVKSVVNEIHDLGFDYWMDTRNLQSGDLWTKEIAEAILACEKILLLLSQASMNSDNVRREVQLAYENKKSFVLLRLESLEIPAHLTYQLAGIQWIERSAPDWKPRLAIALGYKMPSFEQNASATGNRDPQEKPGISATPGSKYSPAYRRAMRSQMELLGDALSRYMNVDLDHFSSHSITETINGLEKFTSAVSDFEELDMLLGMLSNVISHLYVARGYATSHPPRPPEYYQSMNAARKVIMQIRQFVKKDLLIDRTK